MAISSTDMSDQFTLIARNYEGKAARDRTVRASGSYTVTPCCDHGPLQSSIVTCLWVEGAHVLTNIWKWLTDLIDQVTLPLNLFERDRKWTLAPSPNSPLSQPWYHHQPHPTFHPLFAGLSETMQTYIQALIDTSQNSKFTQFQQYLNNRPVDQREGIQQRIHDFVLNHVEDKREQNKFQNFLYEEYDSQFYVRTGRWFQCAFCKVWHTRHNLLPMIPSQDIENWQCHHYKFCHSCILASHENHLLYPGSWLATQDMDPQPQQPMPQLPQGAPDLRETSQRPQALQSLDRERNLEWQPPFWCVALPPAATQTYNAYVLHAWNTDRKCWCRTPLADPHRDKFETPHPHSVTKLTQLATKVWQIRERHSREEFQPRPRQALFNALRTRAQAQNPTASKKHIRHITCQQCLFISKWSANSALAPEDSGGTSGDF